jgi:hypothetical protein
MYSIIFLLSIGWKKNNNSTLILPTFLLIFIIILFKNYGNINGIQSSCGLFLILIFATALYYSLKDYYFYLQFKKMYCLFIYLLGILSIASSVFYHLYGHHDLFNMRSNYGAIEVTPFGFILEKDVLILNIFRSFNFFIEPVYAAYFFYISYLIVNKTETKKITFEKLILIIATFITYSYAVLALILIDVIDYIRKKYGVRNASIIFMLIFFTVIFNIDAIFSFSSLGDRLERASYFISAIQNTSIDNVLFGSGFNADNGADRSFSMGFLINIYELGIIPFGFIFVILFNFLQGDKKSLVLAIVAFLIFDPVRMPLFWASLLLYSYSEKLHINK